MPTGYIKCSCPWLCSGLGSGEGGAAYPDMSRKFKNMLSLQSPRQQLGRLKTVYYLLFFCLASHSLQAQCWQTVAAGIDHTIAIRPDGSLWAWGFNGSGQLGDGSLQNRGTPVQIGTDTDWKVISAAGNQSFAIKIDGTLWAWGDNLWGELGLGTFGNQKNIPSKVGNASDWKSISAGRTFSLAIKNNGTLWAWGENFSGQLGNQSAAAYVPTQVGTATDWKIVAAGGVHTLAIRTEGYGHSLAIKTDGTLWGWGDNNLGQVGDDTFIDKSVPTKIGLSTSWKSISSGMSNSLGIKTDGTIWAWGQIIGKFGFGTDNARKIPTQLADTNWQWNTSESSIPCCAHRRYVMGLGE